MYVGVCVYMCVPQCACHSTCAEARAQLCSVGFVLLLLCGFQELTLGSQVWVANAFTYSAILPAKDYNFLIYDPLNPWMWNPDIVGWL